jgi:hypothetical protein
MGGQAMTRRTGMRLAPGAAALAAAAVLAACFDRLSAGGDATETGNARVSGVVRGEDGRGAAGAEVVLLPSDFNPVAGAAVPDSLKDTTDAEGRYRFDRAAAGEYNVLARDRAAGARSSVWGVRLGSEPVTVPDGVLHAPATLSVPVPEIADSGLGWIYVPGTTLRARIDSEVRSAGRATLDSVPAGLVPSLAYLAAADSPAVVIARAVAAPSGATAPVDAYSAWPHSRALLLNTASGAAALTRDLRDFPLLVRLASPAFDFSQAAPDGSDLRFSAADGSPLPREIESWDPAAGAAAVWVRLDTLRAGRAGQSITLHWGASPASGSPRPRAVFDSAAGYAGVWHLGEEAPDTLASGLYRDATGAGGDGDDRVSSTSTAGAIGAGHGLDSGDYIVAPRPSPGLKAAKTFTLSVWFRSNGKKIGYQGGDLLNVGDNFGIRAYRDSQMHVWYWPPNLPATASSGWNYVLAKTPGILDGQWHCAAGTFDGSVLRLFLDGKEIGNAAFADPMGMQFPLNVTLGKHGNAKRNFEYAGDLDEAQVLTRARDPEWAKISYENQRPGSEFPAFAP